MRSRAAKGVLILVGVSAVLFPAFAWIGHRVAGQNGVIAAAVSLLVVLIPAIVALVVVIATSGTQYALAGGLAGTLIRPFIALAACVVIAEVAPELMRAAAGEMILVWYLILLFVETVTAVRITAPKTSA